MRIISFEEKYRDDMIFMVLSAKNALGRVPGLNEDLLNIKSYYFDKGDMFWIAIDENDREIMELMKGRKAIILFNKSDLEAAVSKEDIDVSENTPIINISAKHQLGIDEFENAIKELFFNGQLKFNDEVYITNARQKNDIRQAYESMKQVKNSIEAEMPEDFFTIDLMNAYELLGRVVGESVEDDLADKIFREFCMGK